jgi:hypothetical protein
VVVGESGGRREWWSKGVAVGKEDLDAMYTRDIAGDVPNMLTLPERLLERRLSTCKDLSWDKLSGIEPKK